jgi:NAD(P)H-hydrate epimerase
MLFKSNFPSVRVAVWAANKNFSNDFKVNLARLSNLAIEVNMIDEPSQLFLEDGELVIDALLGSGLRGPVREGLAILINQLNGSKNEIVSVDAPTGFNCEGPTTGSCIRARHTISFERPKFAFFFPESEKYLGQWHIISIGLSKAYIENLKSQYQIVELEDLKGLFPIRARFSHKGSFGHGLLVAGSANKPGAALLSAEACLRTGIGLLTLHTVASCAHHAVVRLPELMLNIDASEERIGPDVAVLAKRGTFNACALGPGMGRSPSVVQGLIDFLSIGVSAPLVFDADALNIIAEQNLTSQLPSGSILTPHVKEFDRLFGKTESWFERLEKAIKHAEELDLYIILKNAYTFTVCPDGAVFVNSTGNPGLAKAGSGDVLTGILLGLLARGISAKEGAYAAVALHGLASDLAVIDNNENSILATEVIAAIPKAIDKIQSLPKT